MKKRSTHGKERIFFKFAWIMSPSGASLSGKVEDVLDLFLRGAYAGSGSGQGPRGPGAERKYL
jgi:hypothetical protein